MSMTDVLTHIAPSKGDRMNTIKWGIVMVSMLAVMACGQEETPQSVTEDAKPSTSEVQRESKEAAAAIRDFTIEQKEELQAQVQQQLSSLDDKANHLQAKAENAGEDAKTQLNELSADLNQKLQTAKRHAEQLQNASTDTWNDAKNSLASAIDDVEDAYDKAVSSLQ
jgi:gas vesicle protein